VIRAVLLTALVAVAPAMGLAQPTTAQEPGPTGTRIAQPSVMTVVADQTTARRTLHAFGQCIVRLGRAPVEQILAMPVVDPNYDPSLRRLADTDCLDAGVMRMSPMLMRGAMYEALVDIHYGSYRPVSVADVPVAEPSVLYLGVNERPGRATQLLAMNFLAICIVRAAPSPSRALLDAPVGSGAEDAAISALEPFLGPCLDGGRTVSLSRSVLRGAIAEVIYANARQMEAAE
jgi:hypothetical protein